MEDKNINGVLILPFLRRQLMTWRFAHKEFIKDL